MIMRKYYTLSYMSDYKSVVVARRFKTRNQAINYMFKKLPFSAQLSHEIDRGNHQIEYVCTNYSRFFVTRCFA